MNTSQIDFSKVYNVSQKVNLNDTTGLSNYKMSKMPGTTLLYFASFNTTTGKFVTGLDVNAKDVLSIKDPKEREKVQKEILAIKTELEDYYGSPGLLDPTSSFWDGFGIPFIVGEDKQTYIELDGKVSTLSPATNPLHKLALIVLKANNLIPSTREEASSPEFKDSKFILSTTEEEAKMSKETVRLDITRSKYLSELFGDEVQYERAWEIAYFLGLKPKKNISEEALQEQLYIATKEQSFAKKFIAACKLSNEDIATANIFKKAVALNIIKYNGSDKLYFRGGTNFRSTEDESIEFLKTDAMSMELAQLREAVEKKSKTSKNLG